MDRKELLLRWLCRFGMIHGFVMMVLCALARIFGCAWFEDPAFAGRLIPVSLAGTLPGLIYASGRELSAREWRRRTAIHYLLLNALVLPAAYFAGLLHSAGDLMLFAGMILTVDVLVHAALFGLDCLRAAEINRALRQRRGDTKG